LLPDDAAAIFSLSIRLPKKSLLAGLCERLFDDFLSGRRFSLGGLRATAYRDSQKK
jgi:hypothetical protein